ncbi:hypothetical protein WR164_00220 [Philodulcilactobacillus myokoensis]|uniref:Uncharacterized protein n=1 Tax=Philodulcilactobacillus myokoensis TaxID=2929573 RepID=A0A9W6ES52_9LACO|nr:hypothetical protein [Philodulcilactobacillus myokoensis]GLB46043.1 hypothetical protein WR164_00220 [Philodulcilactobacillus myokoensis]
MKKRYVIYILLILIICLTGIHIINQNRINENTVNIYKDNKLKKTTHNKKVIDYMSDFYGDKLGDNTDNGKSLPNNSKLLYRVEIKQTKPHAHIFFNLYKNNYASSRIIFGIKQVVWKVSSNEKNRIIKLIDQK